MDRALEQQAGMIDPKRYMDLRIIRIPGRSGFQQRKKKMIFFFMWRIMDVESVRKI